MDSAVISSTMYKTWVTGTPEAVEARPNPFGSYSIEAAYDLHTRARALFEKLLMAEDFYVVLPDVERIEIVKWLDDYYRQEG